jgi:hypothetical protein
MNQAVRPGELIKTWKDFCLSDDSSFRNRKSVYTDHILAIVLASEEEMCFLLLLNTRCGWTVKITCMTILQTL